MPPTTYSSQVSQPSQPRPKDSLFRKLLAVSSVVLILVSAGLIIFTLTSKKVDAYKVPAGIASDCSRDVTKQLTDWINSLPNGTKDEPTIIDLGSKTCYGLQASVPKDVNPTSPQTNPPLGVWNGVVLTNRHDIEITGDPQNRPELRALADAPRYPNTADARGINRGQLWINGGSNIKISDIIVTGNNQKGGYNDKNLQEYDHNIRIVGATNVTINNVVAQKSNGDGVAIMAKGPWSYEGKGATISKNIAINNSRFDGNGRQGVTIQNGDGIRIQGNTFNNQYYWPIDIEQHLSAQPTKNVTIRSNVITGTTQYGFVNLITRENVPANTGVKNDGTSNVQVSDNKYAAKSLTCREFMSINGDKADNKNQADVQNITISNNTMGVNQYGIKINNAKKISVTDNKGTTRTSTSCTAGDSSNTNEKVFAMTAVGNGVSDLTIRGNSFQRRAGDSPNVQTASFVQVWLNKNTAKSKDATGLKNCGNNTTASATPTSFDQPVVCADEARTPDAPVVLTPTEGQSFMLEANEPAQKIAITGTGEKDAEVQVTINDVAQQTQVQSDGSWKVESTLPAGKYVATVAQSVSGKLSTSTSRAFTIKEPTGKIPTPPIVVTPAPAPAPSQPTPTTPVQQPKSDLSVEGPAEGEALMTPNNATRMLVTIQGRATAGNYVLVNIGNLSQRVRTGADGKWSTRFTLSIGSYTAQITNLQATTPIEVMNRRFSVVQ